jgi:hypothetical protein
MKLLNTSLLHCAIDGEEEEYGAIAVAEEAGDDN